jgi:hypothetical protein
MPKHTEEMDEHIRENLRYDPETGYLWWIKESEHRQGNKKDLNKPAGYIHNTEKYVFLNLNLTSGKTVYTAHRVAWFLHYGFWPKEMLDHINGIRDDNRVKNLREATKNQNEMNKKKRLGCSSKYKGVYYKKDRQKWVSYMKINGQRKHLGIYTSEEEAARAYDKAAREYFGDYACLNFPEEHEQGAIHGHDV